MKTTRPFAVYRQRDISRVALAFAIAVVAGPAFSDGSGEDHSEGKFATYCGVNCVYAALKYVGVDADPMTLLNDKYIGSQDGSTVAELIHATEDHGAHAVALSNLGVGDLSILPPSTILHVKADVMSPTYAHYVVYLGMEKGLVKILDPPNPAAQISIQELAQRWSGNALLISREPRSSGFLVARSRLPYLAYAFLGLVGVWIARVAGKRLHVVARPTTFRGRFGLAATQGLIIVTVAVLFGVMVHVLSPAGYLANVSASIGAAVPVVTEKSPAISVEAFYDAVKNARVVPVDARFKPDFDLDHVEGAINIPPDTAPSRLSSLLEEHDKSTRFVVYCQSEQCPYAEVVIQKLNASGYVNTSYFQGGWVAWTKYAQSTATP